MPSVSGQGTEIRGLGFSLQSPEIQWRTVVPEQHAHELPLKTRREGGQRREARSYTEWAAYALEP